MSCVEKVYLLNLLKGLPDRVTQTQFSLSPALCSHVLVLSFIYLLMPFVLGFFQFSCPHVLAPSLFSVFCFSLSLSRRNMVLIRHFAEPVFLGQTLLKTPHFFFWTAFQTLSLHIRTALWFLIVDSFAVFPCQGAGHVLEENICPSLTPNIFFFISVCISLCGQWTQQPALISSHFGGMSNKI